MDNFIEQIRHFFANCYLIAQDVYRERVWPNIIRTVESLADDNSIKGEISEVSETRNENVFGPQSTINYLTLVKQEVPSGILTRWQLLQMAEKKQPPPPSIRRPQQKPKPLICSRRLFTERSISRASHSNMVAEMDEEDVDFDSVSQTSGLMTPFSSIVDPTKGTPILYVYPTKINNLEQQVALLQKQMAQLMAQQGTSSSAKLPKQSPPLPSSLPNKPTPAMGPPPPPPLLPSFREELLNRKKPPNSNVVLDNNKLNGDGVKKSPSPPLQQYQHQGPTKMGDVLKAIGTVKLKKVNRESPSGPMAKSRKKLQLENDKTVAGILARAMDDRRKKVKLDSEDMEEDQLNKSRPKDGGDWSDEDVEEKENNNNKIVMENGHGIEMDDKENMNENEVEVVEDAFAL